MSQIKDAIKSARVYLNDTDGISWTDSILMPLAQEAFGELQLQLQVNGISVIKNQTAILTVPAGAVSLGADQPSNLVTPLNIEERIPGSTIENFVPMIQTTYLPDIVQSFDLMYWIWQQEMIKFNGALTDKEIRLRYKGSLRIPQVLTDPIGFIFGERFLGPKIAALAIGSIGRDGSKLDAIADRNMYTIIQFNVTDDQRPVRRKAYRSPKWWCGGTTPVVGGAVPSPTIGGFHFMFIFPNSAPDGTAVTFTFASTPKQIVFNGVWLYKDGIHPGFVVVGPNQIQLRDVTGAAIVPDVDADLRAQIL